MLLLLLLLLQSCPYRAFHNFGAAKSDSRRFWASHWPIAFSCDSKIVKGPVVLWRKNSRSIKYTISSGHADNQGRFQPEKYFQVDHGISLCPLKIRTSRQRCLLPQRVIQQRFRLQLLHSLPGCDFFSFLFEVASEWNCAKTAHERSIQVLLFSSPPPPPLSPFRWRPSIWTWYRVAACLPVCLRACYVVTVIVTFCELGKLR